MTRVRLLAVAVLLVGLAVRLPDLGASCNVDGILYWFSRTQRFWEALASGHLERTYFSPHPGVSLMWLSGASMRLFGTLGRPVDEHVIVTATLPIAVLGAIVPALTLPLLQRALGASERHEKPEPVAVLSAFGLATEPFLVAHSRTFQMDALVTGFVWLAVLLAILTALERRVGFALLAGLCLGAAVLTRILSGIFAVSVALGFTAAFLRERPKTQQLPVLLAVMAVTAVAFVVLAWPALLVEPVRTLTRVLRQSSHMVERGHRELSWGTVYEDDPGVAFYAGVFLMRLAPEVLIGALASPFFVRRLPARTRDVLFGLGFAYLLPAIGLLVGPKKADRYALLFFPPLVMLAAFAGVRAFEALRRSAWLVRSAGRVGLRGRAGLVTAVLSGALCLGRLGRLAAVHPLPITWCASYPGLACEDVITLGQGEGFRDVARWIRAHSAVKYPVVLSAYSRGAVMRPWLPFIRPRSGSRAQFVVTYLSTDQRGLERRLARYAIGKPLHEVRYQGRTYARIFRGPRYAQARPHGRRRHHRGR